MLNKRKAEEKRVLDWSDFPPDALSREGLLVPRIASYLRKIVDKYEESEFIKYLVAPSPVALSGFFQCSEEEIHQALNELQRQGYEYETSGSAGPVILWDPLIRRKAARRAESAAPWQQFYQALFNPARRTAAGI